MYLICYVELFQYILLLFYIWTTKTQFIFTHALAGVDNIFEYRWTTIFKDNTLTLTLMRICIVFGGILNSSERSSYHGNIIE